MMGFATCLSLFVEEKKRRGELAMYVMPKALESAWSIARRRSYVPFSECSQRRLAEIRLVILTPDVTSPRSSRRRSVAKLCCYVDGHEHVSTRTKDALRSGQNISVSVRWSRLEPVFQAANPYTGNQASTY